MHWGTGITVAIVDAGLPRHGEVGVTVEMTKDLGGNLEAQHRNRSSNYL